MMDDFEVSVHALLKVRGYDAYDAERAATAQIEAIGEDRVRDCTTTAVRKLVMCRCCGHEVNPAIGGSMPQHRLCDDCGRLKHDECRAEVREILAER